MADERELSEKELDAVLDRLIAGKTPEDILGQSGLVKDLTRRLVERVLEGEMTAHLGDEKHAPARPEPPLRAWDGRSLYRLPAPQRSNATPWTADSSPDSPGCRRPPRS